MTFTDAVEKHGSVLTEDDLGVAYRRCGQSFKGQYGQHFVVLRDYAAEVRHVPARAQATAPMRVSGGGRNRGASGSQTPTARVGLGGGGRGDTNTNRKRKYDDGQSRGRINRQRGGKRPRGGHDISSEPRSDW